MRLTILWIAQFLSYANRYKYNEYCAVLSGVTNINLFDQDTTSRWSTVTRSPAHMTSVATSSRWWVPRRSRSVADCSLSTVSRAANSSSPTDRRNGKAIPLNVAVIGNSGVGKSSFINAIRDLTADDEGAAEVDVVEATTDILPTRTPTTSCSSSGTFRVSEQIVFPGTSTWSCRSGSLRLLPVAVSDADSRRTTRGSARRSLRETRVPLRQNQARHDISNDKKAHPKTHKEEMVISTISGEHSWNIWETRHEDIRCFSIDSYKKSKFDFDELERTLIHDFPDMKRSAMILSMCAFSEEMIRLKAKELRARIWKAAMLSAAVGAIPVRVFPWCSTAPWWRARENSSSRSSVSTTSRCANTPPSLEPTSSNSRPSSTDRAARRSSASKHQNAGPVRPKQVTQSLVSMVAEELTRFIPFVGSAIASTLSFGGTYLALKIVLDKQEAVALEVVRFAAEHAAFPEDEQ